VVGVDATAKSVEALRKTEDIVRALYVAAH
jgi:hypothetical protein